MSMWVEEVIGGINIYGVLNEQPVPGVASLTYWVASDSKADIGPFEAFEAALEAAAVHAQPDLTTAH